MIGHIKITERGPTPGLLAKDLRIVTKLAWQDTGTKFHRDFVPKRFTHEGARELGFICRKGEGLQKGTKAYKRSYTAKKERMFGHTLPNVFTGESRELARIRDVRATSKGARVVLKARKLNFRHPKSRIHPAEEVRRVSPAEAVQLAQHHDLVLGREINGLRGTQTTEVV